jgi:hypothetical protein
VLLSSDVELTEQGAAVGTRRPRPRVDLDPTHVREVDDEASVGSGEPDRGVTTGLHGDLEVLVATECDCGRDLLGVRRASDHRRPAVVDRIPQAARLVVLGVLGRDDIRARPAQLIEVVWGQSGGGVDHGSLPWVRGCGQVSHLTG